MGKPLNGLRYILTIAANERLMLYRTAKFWVLGGLGVLSIVFFLVILNIATFLDSSIPGEFLLDGTDAYLALYFFSYIQVILIVFVAVDFRKLEEKWRLDQVMLSKPMTTANWVLGKYLGVVSSILYVNLFLLLVATIGRLIKYFFLGSGFNILPFLTYFAIATLPSIFFMTALVFFLISLVRVQAIAIFLALAYVVSILAYFHHNYFGLLDYGSFFAPIFSSDLIGFGDITALLWQRLFFLLVTVVLVAASIVLYPRLSQSRGSYRLTWGVLIGFLGAAGMMGFRIADTGLSERQQRLEDFSFHEQLRDQPICDVVHYDLKVSHGDEAAPLLITAEVTVENRNQLPLSQLIFALNGRLAVEQVAWTQGAAIPFKQEHQGLILDIASQPLDPGQRETIRFEYAGNVDGDAFMLDRLADTKGIIDKTNGPWTQPNVSAWVDQRFALLPAQSGWYPVTGAAGGHRFLAPKPMQFFTADLEVETHPQLQIISQGSIRVDSSDASRNRVRFDIDNPVPGLSLNIGKYQRMSHQFKQTLLEFYYDEQHVLDADLFADVLDTCLAAVNRILEVYEEVAGVPYPYERLSIVEVPLHSQFYQSRFGLNNILQQPGIIMIDEVKVASIRIARLIKRKTNRIRRRGQDDSPVRVKRDVFIETVMNIFLPDDVWRRDGSVYSPIKNFLHFSMGIDNPTLARALELQLHEEVDRRVNDIFYPDRWNLNMSANDQMRRNDSSWIVRRKYDLEIDSLITALTHQPLTDLNPAEHGALYRAAVDFKAPPILQMLRAKVGSEAYAGALAHLQKTYRYQTMGIPEFIQAFESHSGTSVHAFFRDWFELATLPGYRITKAEAEKIDTGDMKIQYQLSIRVLNGEKGDGFVKVICNTGNDKVQRSVELGSYEEKEIQFAVTDEPKSVQVVPYFSRNSGVIRKQVSISSRIARKAAVDRTFPVTTALDSLAIVVDDQDDGFFTPVSAAQKYLRPPSKGRSWWENSTSLGYGKYYFGWHVKNAGRGDFPARWETEIPRDGDYNLGFYMRAGSSWWGRNMSKSFKVLVTSADGTFPVEFRPNDTADGWFPLGQFRFEKSKPAIVELSDEGSGYIIADAIRWEFID